MNYVAPIVLWSWLPVVLFIFATRPVRDAIIFSFIFAWMFLPYIGFDIPGLPNYTKMTATVSGVMLSLVLFDSQRLVSFRPKWFDAPIFIFCGTQFCSSISNSQGAWDGFSSVLQQLYFWGFPYFIGRIYLSDLEGTLKLCKGLVIGGLAYIPFCLIEIRLSPQFDNWVYGLVRWEGYRHGGFRPRVFMATGLELGMWMTTTTLVAWVLTASGSVKSLANYSFRTLTIALSIVTVLCKSTGAMSLLIVGLGLAWTSRQTKKTWPIWLLILLPPTYAVIRVPGLWSGYEATEISKILAGEDRAESLEYRFKCEDVLFTYVRKNLIFGYSRNGGFNYSERTGKQDVLIDGYWIIVFGDSGLVGVTAFMSLMLLPMILTLRRFPPRTWKDPEVAPVVGLALILLIYMVDCLSNAMLNPIYGVASGAVMGISTAGRKGSGRLAKSNLVGAGELFDAGHFAEAEVEYRRIIEVNSTPTSGAEERDTRARAFEGLSLVFQATGRFHDAEFSSRQAVAERLALASQAPDADRLQDLATAHESLARALIDLDRPAQAIEKRRNALGLWATLTADRRADPAIRERRAASLNDLAWQLVSETNPKLRNPAEAASLAVEAVRQAPGSVASWNTLGVARYRIGDWSGAIDALERSITIGATGGTAFDEFFLAMACWQLGAVGRARAWYHRAVSWMDQHRPGHPDLASFRSEADDLMSQDPPTSREYS